MAAALEDAIAERLGAGDLHGAATLGIKGYGPSILRYLAAVLKDLADTEEAWSRFAENLWKGLPAFRGECAFRIWAYRIAWNAAQDVGRDPYRRRGRPLTTAEISAIAAQVKSTTPPYRAEAGRERLRRMRDSLDA